MRTLVTMAMMLSLCLGACASPQPGYFISIGSPLGGTAAESGVLSANDLSNPSPCTSTVRLDEVVKNVVEGQEAQSLFKDIRQDQSREENDWNIRKLQIAFERALDREFEKVSVECRQPRPSDVSKKWLRVYSFGATDPDQDLERLREYLISMELVRVLAEKEPVTADGTDKKSQWCGNPKSDDCQEEKHPLYKVFSFTNENYIKNHPLPPKKTPTNAKEGQEFDSVLLNRIGEIITQTNRDTRFFVLGYDIPLDAERTLVRYGVTFYFEDRLNWLQKGNNQGPKMEFVGYTLLYANEATPKPHKAPDVPTPQIPTGCKEARDRELTLWQKGMYATGYPFALAIGLKNAAFEIAKVPFSPIAGLLFGRGSPKDYALENFRTAWDAIQIEATHLPRYNWPVLSGLYNFLTETPLVGYLAQFNTGPEHAEPDLDTPSGVIRRKLFLSRGIYGGDKWGQDTGLWASFAQRAYPNYDVYSPPYRHGTVIDVVWSMFNLSHGPGYSEAKYVMDQDVSHNDRLYLTGHSGGVQRSASASRILVHHGYTVEKVLGIAGPGIGQAYVDTRYPNSFRILLNTQTGANQDVVSKVGVVASAFSTLLDWTVLGPPKYALGGLAGGLKGEKWKREVYAFVDRLGYTNATPTEVDRKPSSEHQTPLRQSLAEPIVFDAYVRSEFASAFREDLERPGPIRVLLPKVSNGAGNNDSCPRTNTSKPDPEEGKGAFRWSR